MSAIIDRPKASLPASAPMPRIEESDDEIARKALVALRSNLCIPAERIMVIVVNGLVTLEGSAEFQVQKLLAEAAVKRLSGITGIRNRIEVKPEDFIHAARIEIEEEVSD
ncbi:MAG: BON domain-containing protein [Acidobacteriota bacterium]